MKREQIELHGPVICLEGDRVPRELLRLKHPPALLRLAGQLPPGPRVAIVGTRFADPEALEFSARLARDLVAGGCQVVSGGALGVDAAALSGALDGGGAPVAVLATGLHRAYPPQHGPLFSRLARQGALLTEAEDDGRPLKGLFLARNRLIAALCQAVVVVQAPVRSGALNTATWAKGMQIPVFAVPSAPWDPRAAGCLGLLRRGAQVCTSALDVLSHRPLSPRATPLSPVGGAKTPCNYEHLGDDARRLLDLLGRRAAHPDKLAEAAGMPIVRIHRALSALAVEGLVRRRSDGVFARS